MSFHSSFSFTVVSWSMWFFINSYFLFFQCWFHCVNKKENAVSIFGLLNLMIKTFLSLKISKLILHLRLMMQVTSIFPWWKPWLVPNMQTRCLSMKLVLWSINVALLEVRINGFLLIIMSVLNSLFTCNLFWFVVAESDPCEKVYEFHKCHMKEVS